MVQSTSEIDESTDESKESLHSGKLRSRVTSFLAAILPFAQSIPPLAVWGGLMTIPLISYLVLLFVSGPAHFLEALFLLFFGGFLWEQIIAGFGLGVLVYSFVHMRIAKNDGLIASGPYQYVRHPQYLGVILFTLTLTTRSYWIATNTFGMSWIDPRLTVAIWFGTLGAYIILAMIEELHLSKTFAEEYEQYRERTGFLLPFVRSQNRGVEVILSVFVLAAILFAIIFMPLPMPPLAPWPGTGDAVAPP